MLRNKQPLAAVALLLTALLTPSSVVAQVDTTTKKPLQVARSEDKAQPRTTAQAAAETDRLSTSRSTPEPTEPRVIMSHRHRATCVKQVGDVIDNATVTDITGSEHKIGELLSDRLTVMLFWNRKSFAGFEQFRRIPVDVLATFAAQRVKVIAVNVGDGAARTKNLTGDAADKIVSLVDNDSKLFHQFATSRIPRTYVLDSTGKILWFDLEYSQSTRRELSNALGYFLKPNDG